MRQAYTFLVYMGMVLVACMFSVSCTSEEWDNPAKGSKTGGDDHTRTVLVYMVESDLSTYLQRNLDEIMEAATEKNLNGGRLVVFYSYKAGPAELYEIKKGEGGEPAKFPVKTYDNISGVAVETMQEVIAEVKSRFPSDSYAMVLSSHGTAWLPDGYTSMLRWFGEENGKKMEIAGLAEAIPDKAFDFLLFDVCSMGSIECVYELKNKADYIVSSPSEVIVDGFPYAVILPYFFMADPPLKKVAEAFYTYYKNTYNDMYGCVSVVDTKALDGLAASVREIVSGKSDEDWFDLPVDEMQLLSFLPSSPIKLYDFDDVIKYMATDGQYALFQEAAAKAIPVQYYTSQVYCSGDRYSGYHVLVDRFSGLSVYPMRRERATLNEYYRELQWYQDVLK